MVTVRKAEADYLTSYYNRTGSQILVVYGKRNVGKTFLLRDFAQDKPCSYYLAESASEREQCFQWGRKLRKKGAELSQYPDYGEILKSLAGGGNDKRVIIIDEFQYLVKAGGQFMKALVDFVHNRSGKVPVLVILCSSSIGWVENSMITRIGESAYGLSGVFKIREPDFKGIMELFPEYSMKRGIETYAVLGGLPGLWEYFDEKLSIKENICRYILNRTSFLYGEGQRIVAEELRETGVYNTLLSAIAAGYVRLNDLYRHTGFSRAKISVYLKNLMELELVERVFPFHVEGKGDTQKGCYRISNHLVNFYFTYLYPNFTSLEELSPGEFYNQLVAPTFKSYVAEYFKAVCRQYIETLSKQKRLPVEVGRVGRWNGKAGSIDIAAQGKNGEILVGICNWSNPLMHYGDYERLLSCAERAGFKTDYIYLFSASYFDEMLNLEAKIKENLKLISMDEL